MAVRTVLFTCLLMLLVSVSAEGEPPDIATVVSGNNAFALGLYRQLADESGNLIFSPCSVSIALAMTYEGARGATAREMATALHLPADRQALHSAHATLLSALDREGIDIPYRLSLANRLWCQRDYGFLPSFLKTCREFYVSGVAELDFQTDPERARRIINIWVAEQTEQKIQQLLLPGDIEMATALVLTNAIYFYGKWSHPFPVESTRLERFHISATVEVDTPTMLQRGQFAYADLPDVEVLQLPYAGEELALVVLLPKEPDGLARLQESLDVLVMQEWLSALEEQEISVALPKFALTWRRELRDALSAMGMPSAFTAKADFSGMTSREDLWIQKVVHESRIEVNEEGTEAAASTAVVMKKSSMMFRLFRADHPFIFLIRDLGYNSILFMGQLVNPQAD